MKKSVDSFFGKMVVKIVLLVFNIMVSSAIIMGALIYLSSKAGIISVKGNFGPLGTVVIMLLTSVILGTIIGCIFGCKLIKPVLEMSAATKKISQGDFTVRIDHTIYKDDDSEISQLIDNFNSMVEKLSKIETLRSDFIANVSHEFKTPLATIQGYVTLLDDDTLTKNERKNYIKIIYEATAKLTTLTSNILKISKLDNQEVKIEIKEYNLIEQIREVIILDEALWEEKNITFDLTFPEIKIVSDEELLKHIWLNILSNAIKYSNQDGKIEIYASSDDEKIIVTFVDHGIGMSEETLSHMFEKFYQGDTSHSKEGSGLGLALVQKILKLLKGTIEVKSELNVGTTVIITLPVVLK